MKSRMELIPQMSWSDIKGEIFVIRKTDDYRLLMVVFQKLPSPSGEVF